MTSRHASRLTGRTNPPPLLYLVVGRASSPARVRVYSRDSSAALRRRFSSRLIALNPADGMLKRAARWDERYLLSSPCPRRCIQGTLWIRVLQPRPKSRGRLSVEAQRRISWPMDGRNRNSWPTAVPMGSFWLSNCFLRFGDFDEIASWGKIEFVGPQLCSYRLEANIFKYLKFCQRRRNTASF